MLGFGILDYVKFAAGIIVGASLVFYPARWIGQSEGKQMAATAALSKSVDLLRERNVVNDQVSSSDAAALCADFGLSDSDQAECVRRLAEAPVEAGNGSIYNSTGPAVRERDCKPQ